MRSIRALLIVISLAASQHILAAGNADVDRARYHNLIEELRCLVCQNQNIAESNAPLAEDLKRQVREMIADGRSDQEIKDYLLARYGDFVLYRPPFKPLTWVLWLGPFGLLLVGIFIAWRVLATGSGSETDTVDEQAVARLLDESGNKGDMNREEDS